MSEAGYPLTQIATRSLFENPDVRVWEMDVGPGETCGLHHHSNDYVLYITSGAELRVDDKDHGPYTFAGRERSVYYIPAGGTESFLNVDKMPFREALIEIKRPARPGQDRGAFTTCEALVGMRVQPGNVCILENDRMRIVETTLAPGQGSGMQRAERDAAVFVVDPGKVKVIERTAAGAERATEETRSAKEVRWEPSGVERGIFNLGPGFYRQISVEIK
jgi:mannose-6-phosphate isomerase-like protein (cupin superfamily)